MTRNKIHLIAAMLLSIAGTCLGGYGVTHDSLYFFYQRSTYLDNLLQDGAWFANPATIAATAKPTLLTVNTFPLGGDGDYSFSSVRFFSPLPKLVSAGIGLTGASGNPQSASFQASQDGADYQSHFFFSRPTLELCAAMPLRYFGSFGVLQSIGLEYVPSVDSVLGGVEYLIWGTGLGWISPSVANMLSFSLSTFSVAHFEEVYQWDHSGKVGLIFNYEELLKGSVEYAFSLEDKLIFLRKPQDPHGYEVVKGLLSLQIYKIMGLLVGYSNDMIGYSAGTEIFPDNNGPKIHLGLELRRNTIYPYYGGYEVAVSPSTQRFAQIVHRFWVGYMFSTPRPLKAE